MKASLLIFVCVAMCYKIQAIPQAQLNEYQSTVVRENENAGSRDGRPSVPRIVAKNNQLIKPRRYQWNTPPVQCYVCVDCPSVHENITVKACSYQDARCVTYAEHYSFQEKPIFIRGCVGERGSCDDIQRMRIRPSSVQLVHCVDCVGDYCNTGPRSLPDLISAIFFVVVTPVLAKYTIS